MLPENFSINGKKLTHFSKNGDSYLVFDPLTLIYYSLNYESAIILYCVSLGLDFDKMIEFIQQEFDISTEECRNYVSELLNNIPIKHLIYHSLIQSGMYLHLEPFNEV